MDHMRDLVQKFVQKGLLEFVYVHHMLWEYTQEALIDTNTHRMNDLVNQLVESGPKLLSTKPGAKVMCAIISHSTAKDRKRIIKTLKGHVLESLLHDSAFLGIIRLVDVTDDTVNVQKSLFDELKSTTAAIKYTASGELIPGALPPLVSIALHRNGHKLLLHLLTPNTRHFEPDEEVLFTTTVETSKKTPELRRKEHLMYLRSALVQVCATHTEELMRSRCGSKVLEAVVTVFHPATVVEAVARVCAGLEVAQFEGDEEEVEEGEGEGEYDEEEGEYDEEGEEEEGEYDEEEEVEEGDEEEVEGSEEEGEEDNEEVDEEVLAEMEEDLQEDKITATMKNTKKEVEVVETVKLPIQEDPIAHLFLKRMLQYEAAVETKLNLATKKTQTLLKDEKFLSIIHGNTENKNSNKNIDVVIDDSLWIDAYKSDTNTDYISIGHQLLTIFKENDDLLTTWVSTNRSCFALVKLFSLPTLMVEILTILNKNNLTILKSNMDKSEGSKLLVQLYDIIKKAK